MTTDQQGQMTADEVPTPAVLVDAAPIEPPLTPEELDAVGAVLRSGWLTMGPRTAELEAACARLLGADASVAVGSAAAALHLALDALGVGPGDDVVVPASDRGAAGAVRAARATPVPAPTPRTRAVVAIGQADMRAAENGVPVLEYFPDGLPERWLGTSAVAVVFGLLPAGEHAGEAMGLLISGDAAIVAHARSRRSHAMTSGTWARHTGNADAYDVEAVGFNHRPDEMRSALVLARLGDRLPAPPPADEGRKAATPFAIPLTDVIVPEDDVEATLAALADGWHGAGTRVEAFERAFAEFNGSAHAVGVTSGTAALHLALLAAGVGPGDEVIVPGFTFVASAAAVRYCGAQPVLCDVVSAANGLIDPEDAAARITSRTRAIVAVHMFGYAADTRSLREVCDARGIVLIEDVAQAVGARLPGGSRAGTGGALGCFSLFSKKQLCTGEGGVVVTDDPDLAARVRALRDARSLDGPGLPQALSEPHAALGLNRLPRLAGDIEVRRAARAGVPRAPGRRAGRGARLRRRGGRGRIALRLPGAGRRRRGARRAQGGAARQRHPDDELPAAHPPVGLRRRPLAAAGRGGRRPPPVPAALVAHDGAAGRTGGGRRHCRGLINVVRRCAFMQMPITRMPSFLPRKRRLSAAASACSGERHVSRPVAVAAGS